MKARLPISLLLALSLALVPGARGQRSFNFDLTVPYYTDASMICDTTELNITERTDVRSISWIFPDGVTLAGADPTYDLEQYTFSGPQDIPLYNLTAKEVEDEVFGYYTCIVVYTDDNEPISVIRWALNVDGADFSDLLETYKENAIIGGVAAGVMLGLIGLTCLIWHVKYGRRKSDSDDEFSDDVTKAKTDHVYNNTSFDNDAADVTVHVENGRHIEENASGNM